MAITGKTSYLRKIFCLASEAGQEYMVHTLAYSGALLQGFGPLLLYAYEGCGLWEPIPIQSVKPFLEMADQKDISAHACTSHFQKKPAQALDIQSLSTCSHRVVQQSRCSMVLYVVSPYPPI